MRYGQLVIGPAGSGKSTYCHAVQEHCLATRRSAVSVVNLDPAAEAFAYQPLLDVRDLIRLDDAMLNDELRFGPNGGLIFCIEYLVENSEWLLEQLGDTDDDYVLFDCPGQIELYTHLEAVKRLIGVLESRCRFRLCSVFLLDAQFVTDGARFLGGTMAALAAMTNLGLPHVNLLSKVDLLSRADRRRLGAYVQPDPHVLLADLDATRTPWTAKYARLTEAIGNLVADYSVVRFQPLDMRDEDSVAEVLLGIDAAIQFGEDADVRVAEFEEENGENDDHED